MHKRLYGHDVRNGRRIEVTILYLTAAPLFLFLSYICLSIISCVVCLFAALVVVNVFMCHIVCLLVLYNVQGKLSYYILVFARL